MGDVTDLIAIPLPEGRQLVATVKTNPRVFTPSASGEPSKPMGLILHWGVIRANTGQGVEPPPAELNPRVPPCTRTRRCSLPSQPSGPCSSSSTPVPSPSSFASPPRAPARWYNDNGRSFRIELGASAAPPRAPAMAPAVDSFSYAAPTYDLSRLPPTTSSGACSRRALRRGPLRGHGHPLRVAAYLKWEQLGKPQVTELQRSDVTRAL